jgi:predicted secreted Zn-dependent protease
MGCRLLDPAVVLEVTTTLPHWRPASPAPARLRTSWSRMVARAGEHEAEHRRHAVDAAQAAAVEMAGVTTGGDCADIERRVRVVLRRASHAAARRSRAFDAATDYGRRAGVRLVD